MRDDILEGRYVAADEIERRYVPADELPVELEERSAEAPRIKGISPPFNSKSVDLGGFREVFAPGAFDKVVGRKRTDPRDDWLGGLIRAKPLKVVAIALANRMARAVWAMLRTGEAWRAA